MPSPHKAACHSNRDKPSQVALADSSPQRTLFTLDRDSGSTRKKVQPALTNPPTIDPGERATIQFQLWLVSLYSVRQPCRFDIIGLEINQPNLIRQNNRQIRNSLNDDQFISQLRGGKRSDRIGQLRGRESRREGQFPVNMGRVAADSAAQLGLPERFERVHVQQPSLMQSIRMVNAMGTQSTFIKAVNGVAKIASAETETGQGRNILDGTASGDNIQAWLSATFLKRAAEACKGELVMRLTNGTKPILVEAGSFTAVIMPMMVEGSRDPFPEDEAIAISLPVLAMA